MVKIVCEHLAFDHHYQRVPFEALFSTPTPKTGDTGSCMAAGGSCSHGCITVEATTNHVDDKYPIHVKPTQTVEPAPKV